MTDSKLKADQFLSISSQFKLGRLETESSHPYTRDLSYLASENLSEAVAKLKKLDNDTIEILRNKKKEILGLRDEIRNTFQSGNNVFLCGCGATGRLSLTVETLWRQQNKGSDMENRVFSFMAGGDVALIRSIENFEDYPDYGDRQLIESGFRNGDLLIGSTEGGETPFVIGSVEKASEISYRRPFFLYCNPDDILCEVAERSKKVIQNMNIEKINLTVGPMAITGSTRMQSSTILLAVAGLALLYYDRTDHELETDIDRFADLWISADISFIADYIKEEADFYQKEEYLLYETDNKLGITVITDTTERSPTFSLIPFENSNEKESEISLCYLYMPESSCSQDSWESLLWRKPRTLEWPDINGIASMKRLLGFDFSSNALSRREKLKQSKRQHTFLIKDIDEGLEFSLENIQNKFIADFSNPVFKHLVLKMILNTHSTLVMGRLGRYEGNIMTYLKASNNKLIDRSIRYIDLLLNDKGISRSYSEICYTLFRMLEKIKPDQPIVMATVNEIVRKK